MSLTTQIRLLPWAGPEGKPCSLEATGPDTYHASPTTWSRSNSAWPVNSFRTHNTL
jgi:hypothetical protein